jgi:hypothetical protein
VSGLFRVSRDGHVEKRFVVGPDATAVAAADEAVWVAIRGPGKLVEIDPTTNSKVAHVTVGTMSAAGEPQSPVHCNLAVSGYTVWAPATGESSPASAGIWRVDGLHNLVSAVIRSGGNPCGVSLGHGRVWVTNPSNYEVDEIDPLANHLLQRIPLDAPPTAIASAPRHVWVVTG